MTKTFCDKCGIELTENHIMNYENNITFTILDVEIDGRQKIAHVCLNPVHSWDNFDICRKCALEAMKSFIDGIDFSDEQSFKNDIEVSK